MRPVEERRREENHFCDEKSVLDARQSTNHPGVEGRAKAEQETTSDFLRRISSAGEVNPLPGRNFHH